MFVTCIFLGQFIYAMLCSSYLQYFKLLYKTNCITDIFLKNTYYIGARGGMMTMTLLILTHCYTLPYMWSSG